MNATERICYACSDHGKKRVICSTIVPVCKTSADFFSNADVVGLVDVGGCGEGLVKEMLFRNIPKHT